MTRLVRLDRSAHANKAKPMKQQSFRMNRRHVCESAGQARPPAIDGRCQRGPDTPGRSSLSGGTPVFVVGVMTDDFDAGNYVEARPEKMSARGQNLSWQVVGAASVSSSNPRKTRVQFGWRVREVRSGPDAQSLVH